VRWADIRSIAVISGPAIGAGLDKAPDKAGRARIEDGFTTFVIQPSEGDDEPEAGISP
jgi:hypothetical protein